MSQGYVKHFIWHVRLLFIRIKTYSKGLGWLARYLHLLSLVEVIYYLLPVGQSAHVSYKNNTAVLQEMGYNGALSEAVL